MQSLYAVPSYQKQKGHPVWISAYAAVQNLLKCSLSDPKARLDRQVFPESDLQKVLQTAIVPVNDPKVRMQWNTVEQWEEFLAFQALQ